MEGVTFITDHFPIWQFTICGPEPFTATFAVEHFVPSHMNPLSYILSLFKYFHKLVLSL